jgi:hypothetical protein
MLTALATKVPSPEPCESDKLLSQLRGFTAVLRNCSLSANGHWRQHRAAPRQEEFSSHKN